MINDTVKDMDSYYDKLDSQISFAHEMKILRQLQGKTVPGRHMIIESFEGIDGHIYTRFMPNGDLSPICWKLTEERVFQTRAENVWTSMASFYISELMSAAYQLHTLGYVHLDIKALQFLVSKDGYLKMADFGMALSRSDTFNMGFNERAYLNGTYRFENCCTNLFSAPETAQFSHGSFEFEDLKAIDYWAIGTIIALLAGYIPYHTPTINIHRQNIQKYQVTHPVINELMHTLTNKDPSIRASAYERFCVVETPQNGIQTFSIQNTGQVTSQGQVWPLSQPIPQLSTKTWDSWKKLLALSGIPMVDSGSK